MHTTQFLRKPEAVAVAPMIALFGDDRYLKQQGLEQLGRLLLGDDAEFNLVKFPGASTELRNVLDELRMVSMWGDRRLIVIDDADDFVSANRAALEKYLDKPAAKSVLVLDVKRWPGNTRLAKQVEAKGLSLECTPLQGNTLTKWIAETCRTQHQHEMTPAAIQLLVDLVGSSLAVLDQELAKLSSFAGERTKIDVDDVTTLVGGWKAETTWDMLRAVNEGQIGKALTLLDKLLVAGEPPLKILGGVSSVFRKLSKAVDLAVLGTPLPAALSKAGVFPRDIGTSEKFLRRMGRHRAGRFREWLAAVDRDLKGASPLPERLLLERALIRLSGFD
ncbi:MAG: DNA polymerase III subunit delta [Planctomycetota bacterium]|nr:DNA polymerase III subunit delta [Planctomycetota bacterium]MDA1211212.1 DNA polymerase III subunit delta [Planctomycetota bacterium]